MIGALLLVDRKKVVIAAIIILGLTPSQTGKILILTQLVN